MHEEHNPPENVIRRRTFLAASAAGAALAAGVGASFRPAQAKEKAMSGGGFREKLLECLGGPWPEPPDDG